MERRGFSHRGLSLTVWGPGWKLLALLMISIGPRAARPAVMRAGGSSPEGDGELDTFFMHNTQHSKGRVGIGLHAGQE